MFAGQDALMGSTTRPMKSAMTAIWQMGMDAQVIVRWSQGMPAQIQKEREVHVFKLSAVMESGARMRLVMTATRIIRMDAVTLARLTLVGLAIQDTRYLNLRIIMLPLLVTNVMMENGKQANNAITGELIQMDAQIPASSPRATPAQAQLTPPPPQPAITAETESLKAPRNVMAEKDVMLPVFVKALGMRTLMLIAAVILYLQPIPQEVELLQQQVVLHSLVVTETTMPSTEKNVTMGISSDTTAVTTSA